MSQPNSRIYVDPDGVTRTGGQYDEQAMTYADRLAHIHMVRSQYGDSWGNDEMGRQFGENFAKGMDSLELIIKGTVGVLQYTADGLRSGGRDYRNADEDARDAGLVLLRHSEDLPGTGGPAAQGTPTGATAQATLRSGAEAATPQTPSKPAMLAVEPSLPVSSNMTSTIPSFSAYDTRDLSGTYVNGQPLSDGRRLVAFAPLPDGTVHVDTNRYESLTPVAGSAVTGPNGQPIDPDGRRFFVVRDAPGVDPTAPGYQPLNVAYPAGRDQPPI